MELLILILSFFILLIIGVPVGWALGISGVLTLLTGLDSITALTTFGQQFMTSLDSFTLLAIPFFILAGQIMNRGGIAQRLIDFAKSLIGSLPGGLAHINVVAAMLFGAIAGSSVAAASAITATPRWSASFTTTISSRRSPTASARPDRSTSSLRATASRMT